MKYYAHFGHRDFILCLGYRADVIKNYFLQYNECVSNDFVLTNGGKDVQMLKTDAHDWRITFVDTGITSNIGQRLKKVEKYLDGEDVFLANYSDGLTDFPLPRLIERLQKSDKTAAFLSVKPNLSYHFISADDDGVVRGIADIHQMNVRVNGGYFVFRREIFDYIREKEELVVEPFQRLIKKEQLTAIEYDGFFGAMDTFKDKQQLEDLYASGAAPWEMWKRDSRSADREIARNDAGQAISVFEAGHSSDQGVAVTR
jgi:glucose-1-phosphate cytidylyltransferase